MQSQTKKHVRKAAVSFVLAFAVLMLLPADAGTTAYFPFHAETMSQSWASYCPFPDGSYIEQRIIPEVQPSGELHLNPAAREISYGSMKLQLLQSNGFTLCFSMNFVSPPLDEVTLFNLGNIFSVTIDQTSMINVKVGSDTSPPQFPISVGGGFNRLCFTGDDSGEFRSYWSLDAPGTSHNAISGASISFRTINDTLYTPASVDMGVAFIRRLRFYDMSFGPLDLWNNELLSNDVGVPDVSAENGYSVPTGTMATLSGTHLTKIDPAAEVSSQNWISAAAVCSDFTATGYTSDMLNVTASNPGNYSFFYTVALNSGLCQATRNPSVVEATPVEASITSDLGPPGTVFNFAPAQSRVFTMTVKGTPPMAFTWTLYSNGTNMTISNALSIALKPELLQRLMEAHLYGRMEFSAIHRATDYNFVNGSRLIFQTTNIYGTASAGPYILNVLPLPSPNFTSTTSASAPETSTGSAANADSSSSSSSLLTTIAAAVAGGGGGLILLLVLACCCVCCCMCFALACVVLVVIACAVVAIAIAAGLAALGGGGGSIAAIFGVRRARKASAAWQEMESAIEERRQLDLEEIRRRVNETTTFREIPETELQFGRKIGSGAYGAVFIGRWQDAPVAIKVLQVENGVTEEAVEEFRQEATVMAKVGHHPNVLHFVGASMSAERLCLVTHYCKRGSLLHVLQNENVEHALLVRMAADAAAGVAFLHSQGVIHRDIAARNVLVGDKYDVYIADFGYSRIFAAGNSGTQTTKSDVGPVRWMAPEAMARRQYSAATDVFSFGVLLWEMLSGGDTPYAGHENLLELSGAIIREGLRPSLDRKWGQDLCDLVASTWVTDPSQRPSMHDVHVILERLASANSTESDSHESNCSDSDDGDYVAPGTLVRH